MEKYSVYFRLCEDQFYKKIRCIIVTAKGVPDVATRYLLKKIKDEFYIPVLGLMDFDPSGLRILSIYRYGSNNMSYDRETMATKGVHGWVLGMKIVKAYTQEYGCLSMLQSLSSPSSQFFCLTNL